MFAFAAHERVVFIIDEYPYLAAADKSVPSTLQMLIDRHHQSSLLFLVLCGSSLSFMREQVLGEKSPLYGRRTAQLEVKPFDFFDARRFFANARAEDALAYYGMVSGIPLYLQRFDERLPLEENVAQSLLNPASLLYEEPTNLLMQEVRKASLYSSIIAAIASGKTTNNEIAMTAGISSSELGYYLNELQRIGVVEKELPVLGSARRGVYRLTDNLFRFWHRFVYPNRAAIERGLTKRVASKIDRELSDYLGGVFEAVCRDWLWRQSDEDLLPVEFDDLGRWWGNNPVLRREEEVDIVGVADGGPVLLAECKWRGEATGLSVLETLVSRAALLHASAGAQLCVFSRAGFTDACLEAAKGDSHVTLVGFADMLD